MTKASHLIGLTGSIGSGKSTVAALFEAWGSKIVDFDVISKSLLTDNPQIISRVSELFGAQILRPDKSIDRFALRSLIFSDAGYKAELEGVLHPEIRKQADFMSVKLLEAGASSVTMVIPLLFESKQVYKGLTETVVVAASRADCIARATSRDNCQESLIASIYDSQMPIEEKVQLADYVIRNESSLSALEKNARDIFELIHTA